MADKVKITQEDLDKARKVTIRLLRGMVINMQAAGVRAEVGLPVLLEQVIGTAALSTTDKEGLVQLILKILKKAIPEVKVIDGNDLAEAAAWAAFDEGKVTIQ